MRTLILLFALTLSCLAQPLSPNDPAFLQSTSPLRRGLIGYWRLEEASGTRYDCSQYGGELTSNNSVGQVSGKQGNAASFVAGSLQSLTVSNNVLLAINTNTAITLCAWIRPTATANQVFAGYIEDAFPIRGWCAAVNGSQNIYWLQSGGNPTKTLALTGSTTITNNVWWFYTATLDGSNTTNGLHLYVNGILESGSYSGDGMSGSLNDSKVNAFAIGCRGFPNISPQYFTGYVDELGIWTRVLTASEITFLYNSSNGTHFPWSHP